MFLKTKKLKTKKLKTRKLKTRKLKIQKFNIAASPQQFKIQNSTIKIQ